MRGPAASLALVVGLAPLLAGCFGTAAASPSPPPSPGSSVTLAGGLAALRWGDGPYGVVLLHDGDHDAAGWASLAHALAADGMTALAPQATDEAALRTAIQALRAAPAGSSSPRIERVAVVAAGDSIGAILQLAGLDPTLIDQAILISPRSDARWTAEFPKLFIAASASPEAPATRTAEAAAAGQWNALLMVEGGASGQALFEGSTGSELVTALVRRLDERR